MAEKQTLAIDGVKVIPKRKIFDDRGGIFHMLRVDDPEFSKFGEIYFSQVYPDVIKAWHLHSRMTLNYLIIVGSIRFGLYDPRKDSPTYGKYMDLTLHEANSQLVVVPPGVWNGFKGLGTGASIVANCATEPHDPLEITRKPPNDPLFSGFDWAQRHG